MLDTVKELQNMKRDFDKFCRKHASCNNCRFNNDKENDCFYLYLHEKISYEEEYQAKLKRRASLFSKGE